MAHLDNDFKLEQDYDLSWRFFLQSGELGNFRECFEFNVKHIFLDVKKMFFLFSHLAHCDIVFRFAQRNNWTYDEKQQQDSVIDERESNVILVLFTSRHWSVPDKNSDCYVVNRCENAPFRDDDYFDTGEGCNGKG